MFATAQINRSKDDFYLLQNNTNQSFQCIYKLMNINNINNIILNKRFLVFKTQGFIYYHELVFYKLVNLQKPRYQD